MCRLLLWLGLLAIFFQGAVVYGAPLTYEDLKPLGDDDFDAKAEVILKVRLAGGPLALRLLEALQSESVVVSSSGKIFIQQGTSFFDPITGAPNTVSPDDVQSITINNLLRSQISESVNALQLQAEDPSVRARAIDGIFKEPDPSLKPVIDAARAKEKDPILKGKLDQLWALTALQDPEVEERLKAVKLIGDLGDPQMEGLLLPLTVKKTDGSYNEPDPKVRTAVLAALEQCRFEERKIQLAGTIFAGLSLGSILVLAALGLAITYGLIGVINMAHGEFLMLGAYATYVTQEIFKAHFAGALDWYPIIAVPVSFFVAAISGFVLERCVLRLLYGRPLETLLTTFGVSLVIIQTVRTLFGAQNVQVSNPSWMSGGIAVMPHLILPFNRIVIIGFAFCVVGVAGFVLNKTRLGLFVRAVTQNRRMAACSGVRTWQVDSCAFAFGAGIAGLGGCALSQIGNVGPDLGQTYIIDSFMVVVLGGVGQLAGTIIGGMGLGVLNKMIEPFWGAVLAKIAVLVLIVLFIQKRPRGLFALKGRSAEA